MRTTRISELNLTSAFSFSNNLCWKYGPQNDHVERSDLAKRFFIAGWERERAKRAKKEGGGRGLNTPQ
jgi:hypothetical protein